MTPGVEFEILWFDADLIEVRVSASNGSFSGSADCYVPRRGGLAKLADTLRGFPETAADTRSLELGDFRADTLTGGARLDLRCTSATGHAAFEVRLLSHDDHSEEASFPIPIEVAGIDRLVADLDEMTPQVSESVSVPMANVNA